MTSPERVVALWSGGVQHVAEDSSTHFLDRLRQGDATALTFLYREHHQAVRAFARRLLGDPTIAEDLVHDVFVAAPDAFRLYRRDAELRTFLISIAVNKAKHHVRSAVRARRMLEKLEKEPPPPRAEPPDESWERHELCAELQRALDELPLEQRVVIILCAVEERTAAEVASIVGAPENTVRTRLFHAKRKLRESMGGAV
jgi:RNA polymerase sigma-70 factor (ECF subfamily)